MMKRYSHHTFSVQSPHTMDAILFRDVKIRNCGYRPLQGMYKQKIKTVRYPYIKQLIFQPSPSS